MTLVGLGGVQLKEISYTDKFKRDFKSLAPNLKDKARDVIAQILLYPHPRSLRFEKLKGIKNPAVFTVHLTGNHSHKISLEIKGSVAILRRIGTHSLIDRNP